MPEKALFYIFKEEKMRELNGSETQTVSGGIIQFTVGYVASKLVDVAVDSVIEHGMDMSQSDHTGSNQYFLENRGNFNPLI